MGISDWVKRLRRREDSEALERFEEEKMQREDLPEGERFLAGEDRVAQGIDEQIVRGNLRGTIPTDDDS
jgi:hypothetical protein